jgi:uncharacterized protein (DUF486 family)
LLFYWEPLGRPRDFFGLARLVITLNVFVPFAMFSIGKPLKFDYLWAALCIMGAVYFVFRTPGSS